MSNDEDGKFLKEPFLKAILFSGVIAVVIRFFVGLYITGAISIAVWLAAYIVLNSIWYPSKFTSSLIGSCVGSVSGMLIFEGMRILFQ